MKTKLFFLVSLLFLLTSIFVGCRKDDPEPEPPVLKPPFLQVWASPESVAFRGSSTIEWRIENVKKVQVGTLVIESPFGGSVTYANLLKDTSIFCSATGYNNQVIRDTVYIKVVQPPVVVPKTAKDTLMSMYWVLIDEKVFSGGSWVPVRLNENQLRYQLYFNKDEFCETKDPKDGKLIGNCKYKVEGHTLIMGSDTCRFQINGTSLSLYKPSGDQIVNDSYLGFKI